MVKYGMWCDECGVLCCTFWQFILSENDFCCHRIDYGCGEEVQRVARKEQCGPAEWLNIKFMVFDTPSHPTATFEERMSILSQVCLLCFVCVSMCLGVCL